ncbi:MAG: hypothetical protein AAF549_09815, partial [Pseudomonadota bacterium]
IMVGNDLGGTITSGIGDALGDRVADTLGISSGAGFALDIITTIGARRLAEAGLTEEQLTGIGAATLNYDPSLMEQGAQAFFSAIPVVGGLIKGGMIGEMHEDFAIEMAERGVPGFLSEDVVLSDGTTFTIYADGSGRASPALKASGEPRTTEDGRQIAGRPHSFPHRNDFDDLSDADQRTILGAQERLEQEAYAEVEGLIRRPGGLDNYNDRLQRETEDYAQEAREEASLQNEGSYGPGDGVEVSGSTQLASSAGLIDMPSGSELTNTVVAAPAAPAVA